jgi:voltage-gated potassium channel
MSAAASGQGLRRLRHNLHLLLDRATGDRLSARLVHGFLVALIVVNVAAVVLESVPALQARYARLFFIIEIASVVVFTLEYLVRLWIVPENRIYHGWPAGKARLRYAVSAPGIIDLIAIVPLYTAMFGDSEFKVFLLLRLLRFLKLARYSPGMRSLTNVLYQERKALFACFIILVGVALVAATCMHLAEQDAQPDKFGSIPDALWWAVITLTTVGYGDVYPITPLGKLIAGLTSVTGLVMLALPVGLIATGFAEDIHRREFVVTWSMVARVPLFAGLDAAQIGEIIHYLKAQTAESGAVVVRRGEAGTAMYFIAAGAVEIELPQRRLRLEEGQFFGELAILHAMRRTATVRALTATKLLVLDANDFHMLMERHPEIARHVSEASDERRRQLSSPDEAGRQPTGDED